MATDPDGRLIVNEAAFSCVVIGSPAAQGSKHHVGNGVMIESSKAVEPWRQDVVKAARDVLDSNAPPLDGPLRVSLTFTLRKPASAPKRRTTWPDKRPDIDKLVRSTFDALTTAGVWTDDARVVHLLAEKCFAGEHQFALPVPGCVVRVWRVDG